MLHVVSQSPFIHTSLSSCLKCIQAEDQLLLIQDAVIASSVPSWFSLVAAIDVYVLQDDLVARGLINQVGIAITMEGYVNLVAQHGSPICW
jgi:tRNA 2-thiouridine synthesizing protein B